MTTLSASIPHQRTPLHWAETLRDRSHVLIRPIGPADRAAERAFIQGLSPRTRRFRFLGQVATPSDADLARFTEVDHARDEAFVALTGDGAHERIVGVSRYGTDAQGLRCECAVVVDDAWQGRGLGTLLMRHLVEVARSRGIGSIYSLDSAENLAMADLAHAMGFRTRVDPDDASQVIHELAL